MSPRRGAAAIAVVAVLALTGLAGCGNDDFENKPKPAIPVEATIEITTDRIDVSPLSFGAGLVTFVIANNSTTEAALEIEGPVDETSSPIPGNGNGVFKIDMKSGNYTLTVPGNEQVRPTELKVGPPRPPSNNDLLQP